MNKTNTLCVIMIALLLIPLLILAQPFMLICRIKKVWNNREANKLRNKKQKQKRTKRYSVTYIDPKVPLPDAVFAERIGEFTCLQFWSCNGYTGGIYMSELVAADHPEKKEQVLAFLQEHPIADLLHGDRYEQAKDMSNWKISFIFDDTRLNRTILGYGHTKLTSPYLKMIYSNLTEI